MSEEKTVLYTRKYPASDGGLDDQAEAMEKVAAEAGYELTPRGFYCEGQYVDAVRSSHRREAGR